MRILLAILLLIPNLCFAADKVSVQLCFRKALWTCPQGDEITDLNADGTPSIYTHTCAGGMWLNDFKEYNGCIRYTPEEYEKADSAEKTAEKQALVDKWIYDMAHPAPVVEPSKLDYLNMYQSRMEEAQGYLEDYSKVADKKELEAVKADLETKVTDVTTKIDAKTVVAEIIE